MFSPNNNPRIFSMPTILNTIPDKEFFYYRTPSSVNIIPSKIATTKTISTNTNAIHSVIEVTPKIAVMQRFQTA